MSKHPKVCVDPSVATTVCKAVLGDLEFEDGNQEDLTTIPTRSTALLLLDQMMDTANGEPR